MVLRPQGNLLKIRVVPANAMRQSQCAVGIDTRLQAVEGLKRKPVRHACDAEAIPARVRRQAHEIQPVADNQAQQEGSCKESGKYHGPSRFRSESAAEPLAFP